MSFLLKKEQTEEPPKKKTIIPKPKTEKPIPLVENISTIPQQVKQEPKTLTLDAIRGLYLLATGIGDKTAKKEQLEAQLKTQLLTPKAFGKFLETLAQYLQTI